MMQRSAGGRFLEVSLFTLSSLVLYHIGIGVIVFLIPLQVVASRRGNGALLFGCCAFLLVFLALRFLPFLGGALRPDILTVVEIVLVAFLILGLLAVNTLRGLRRKAGVRTLYLLVASSAVFGMAAIPMGIWLSRSAQFQQAMEAMFSDVSRMLGSLFSGREAAADASASALLSPTMLRNIAEAYASRSLLPTYFLLLSFSWWAGQLSAVRSGSARKRFHFADFRLENYWLWPLIAAGALILADLFLKVRQPGGGAAAARQSGEGLMSWLALAGWNVGLMLLILYGLQGLAILRFVFERRGLPRVLWLLLVVGLVALSASPRAGIVVMLALPAFGVSETWIRYRVAARREPNESQRM